MKNILLVICLFVIGGRSYGQHNTASLIKNDSSHLAFRPQEYKFHYDTSSVVMLCSDTLERLPKNVYAVYDSDGTWHPGLLVIWKYGYEVQKVFDYPFAPEFICYLDSNKKSLKYFVWMSKQLPK